MPSSLSRRTYLVSAGALAGVGSVELIDVVGGRAGGGGLDCEDESALREELDAKQATLTELQTELSTVTSQVETLREEIPAARQRKVERDAVYPEGVRETAKTVGMAARESVIYLSVRFARATASGTAWFVGDGQVLTNSHNVSETDQIEEIVGWTIDGERIGLTLVDRVEDLSPDVALLETDHDAPALPTVDSSTLETGQPLIVVGHPGGYGNWVISLGEFEQRQETYDSARLVTDIPNLQGNSGSPTLTLEGEVVAQLKGAAGIGNTTGAPPVADDRVQTEPIATREEVLHDPIEVALETMEGWT